MDQQCEYVRAFYGRRLGEHRDAGDLNPEALPN
jgi:hypothetical protein